MRGSCSTSVVLKINTVSDTCSGATTPYTWQKVPGVMPILVR